MSADASRSGGTGAARLALHAQDCEECRAAPLPIDRLAMALESGGVGVDAAALSARVWIGLQRELRVMQRISWRRVVTGLLWALLPLPAVLACDRYVLGVAYTAASVVLPSAFVTYLVASYAAAMLFVFALTYAALPVLMARRAPVGAGTG